MAEGKVHLERREHPRFSIAMKMDYEVVGSAGKQKAQTGDISAGGVRIYVQQPARRGDRLKVAIDLDEGKSVEADATVAWVRRAEDLELDIGYKFAMGLKFSHIKSEDSSFITKFVEKCLKGK